MPGFFALSVDAEKYKDGFLGDLFWQTFYQQHLGEDYAGLATYKGEKIKIRIIQNVPFKLIDNSAFEFLSASVPCFARTGSLFHQSATGIVMKSSPFGILPDETLATVTTFCQTTEQVCAGHSLRVYAGERPFFQVRLSLLEGVAALCRTLSRGCYRRTIVSGERRYKIRVTKLSPAV